MRLKYIFLTLFWAFSNTIYSQFLHTPEELEEIVIKNPNKYILQAAETLTTEGFQNCRVGTEEHNLDSNALNAENPLDQVLDKGAKKKLKKRNKKILKNLKSSDLAAKKELSSIFFRLGDYGEALRYKSMLPTEQNSNFEDAYFLAKSYFEIKQYDKALNHAFHAKLLFPYQKTPIAYSTTSIEQLLENILAAQKSPYQNWKLDFSYCITNRDGKIYISFNNEPWKTYAICKAVWQEDAEHKSKMSTISDQEPWLVEEKECLLNTLVSYMRHEPNNPDFDGLQYLAKALDEDYVREFILYERFIAQYQAIPNGIPSQEQIEKLLVYFKTSHTAGK